MLYLKSHNDISKYYVRSDNKFIVKKPGKGADIIIDEVTGEFDGVCPEDGSIHFLIQSTDGSLVYLKYENDSWRKYIIFKSKNNTCNISSIRLTYSEKKLCAFYALVHGEKTMLVRHIFSDKELYTVPEVVDLLDVRKDFCICTDVSGNTHLFYRNRDGERIEKIYSDTMTETSSKRHSEDDNTYSFTAVCNAEGIYRLYTSIRKSYTALILRTCNDEEKIITFAVARNCRHAVSTNDGKVTVQWSEEGRIMQTHSENHGKSFCRPYVLKKDCDFSKVRIRGIRPGLYCNEYAVSHDNMPDFTIQTNKSKDPNHKETATMNNAGMRSNYRFVTSEENKAAELIKNLENIEARINSLGKSLEKICKFLEKPPEFKNNIDNNEFSVAPKAQKTKTAEETNDIGEKNEENIKLFESTDIDSVIPPKNEINVNQIL